MYIYLVYSCCYSFHSYSYFRICHPLAVSPVTLTYKSGCECDWDCPCCLACECCEVVASEIALVSASVVMWVWMKMWVWVGKCICGCIISILIQERMMCNLDTCSVKNCSVRTVQSKCVQRVMLMRVHVCVWIGALIKHCRWGRSHGSGRLEP